MDITKGISIIEAAGGKLCGNKKTFHVGRNKYVKYPNKQGVFGLYALGRIIGHATTEEELKKFLATDYNKEVGATTTARPVPPPVPSTAPSVSDMIATAPSLGVIRMVDGKTFPATVYKTGPSGAGTPITPKQRRFAQHLGIQMAENEFDRIGLSGAIRVAKANGYEWADEIPSATTPTQGKPKHNTTPSTPAPSEPILTLDERMTRIENLLLKITKGN